MNYFYVIYNKFLNSYKLQEISSNFNWLFLEKFLRIIIGLVIGIWLARYLGPEKFGQLNYAIAFVGIFSVIATMGLNNLVVRDLVQDQNHEQEILGSACALSLLGGLVSYCLICLIVLFSNYEEQLTKTIIYILGFSSILRSSDVIRYWYESKVASRYVVWVECSVLISAAAVKAILILLKVDLIYFVWCMFFETTLIGLGLVLIYLSQKKKHM